jgi:hypothetical protein
MPGPRFPIYIVSKGRSDWAMARTARTLDAAGVPYKVIIEPAERAAYAATLGDGKLLDLPPAYAAAYEPLDDGPPGKSLGPGPARNFAWDHAVQAGATWHWVMDDNIKTFYRLAHGKRLYAETGGIFAAMEAFVLRYDNIAIAGPAYAMFAPERGALPPFTTNTRIYSCLLIRNDLGLRWRGRYNEDTDLSLRALKAGWVTVQFNAFLQQKSWTAEPALRGGNTDDFYRREGTLPKSAMLVRTHPDVARLTWRFGRAHHYVDYRRFRQRLRFAPGAELPAGTPADEMGMRLVAPDGPPRSPALRAILDAET